MASKAVFFGRTVAIAPAPARSGGSIAASSSDSGTAASAADGGVASLSASWAAAAAASSASSFLFWNARVALTSIPERVSLLWKSGTCSRRYSPASTAISVRSGSSPKSACTDSMIFFRSMVVKSKVTSKPTGGKRPTAANASAFVSSGSTVMG